MSFFKSFTIGCVLPFKNDSTLFITSEYSDLPALPIQGALHLEISNSIQAFLSLPVINLLQLL